VTGNLDGAIGTSNTGTSSGVITDTTTYRAIAGVSATFVGTELLASASPSFAYARSHDSVLKKDRDFALLTGSGAAVVQLGDAWSFHLTAAGQFTQERLLPADLLFQIGGPSSVRGYPAGTFAGDSGFYAEAEIHHQFRDISKGLDVYLFSDNGAVYSTKPAMRSLDSLGVGASLTPVPAVTFSASVGVPLRRVFANQNGQEFYLQMMVRL
jgi:hemolysin activation/secretion protein